MKIKRFFADDIRQAIRMVREELGSDAVILSNRSAGGGIEIVAATEYDEQLVNSMATVASVSAASAARGVAGNEQAASASEAVRSEESSMSREPAASAARAEEKTDTAHAASAAGAKPTIVWAQEPALVEMRSELKSLRGLLEEQLSGLAWGDLAKRYPRRAKLLRRLMELGLSASLCQLTADVGADDADFERAFRHALAWLAHRLPVGDDDILNNGGVVALVGPTGVGKTTTIAKLAARFALRHGAQRAALITTDNYRIGAHEQLRIYGRILGIPVRVATDKSELRSALESLSDKSLILIDTAGMSQRDVRLSEQFTLLNEGGVQNVDIKTYVVLSATSSLAGLAETVRAFQGVALAGCILTKLDEATSLGGALSVAIENALPVAYVSNGQRVPEDMQPARAHSLVIRSVSLMQHTGEMIEEEMLEHAFGESAAHAG